MPDSVSLSLNNDGYLILNLELVMLSIRPTRI